MVGLYASLSVCQSARLSMTGQKILDNNSYLRNHWTLFELGSSRKWSLSSGSKVTRVKGHIVQGQIRQVGSHTRQVASLMF